MKKTLKRTLSYTLAFLFLLGFTVMPALGALNDSATVAYANEESSESGNTGSSYNDTVTQLTNDAQDAVNAAEKAAGEANDALQELASLEEDAENYLADTKEAAADAAEALNNVSDTKDAYTAIDAIEAADEGQAKLYAVLDAIDEVQSVIDEANNAIDLAQQAVTEANKVIDAAKTASEEADKAVTAANTALDQAQKVEGYYHQLLELVVNGNQDQEAYVALAAAETAMDLAWNEYAQKQHEADVQMVAAYVMLIDAIDAGENAQIAAEAAYNAAKEAQEEAKELFKKFRDAESEMLTALDATGNNDLEKMNDLRSDAREYALSAMEDARNAQDKAYNVFLMANEAEVIANEVAESIDAMVGEWNSLIDDLNAAVTAAQGTVVEIPGEEIISKTLTFKKDDKFSAGQTGYVVIDGYALEYVVFKQATSWFIWCKDAGTAAMLNSDLTYGGIADAMKKADASLKSSTLVAAFSGYDAYKPPLNNGPFKANYQVVETSTGYKVSVTNLDGGQGKDKISHITWAGYKVTKTEDSEYIEFECPDMSIDTPATVGKTETGFTVLNGFTVDTFTYTFEEPGDEEPGDEEPGNKEPGDETGNETGNTGDTGGRGLVSTGTADVVINDELTPLANIQIPDEPAPLADIQIMDEETPLAAMPSVEIEDGNVPLAEMPQTGADNSMTTWIIGLFLSMAMTFVLLTEINRRKRVTLDGPR